MRTYRRELAAAAAKAKAPSTPLAALAGLPALASLGVFFADSHQVRGWGGEVGGWGWCLCASGNFVST